MGDTRPRLHESTPRGVGTMTVNSRSNVSRQDCLWVADDETATIPALWPESASAMRSSRSVVRGSQSLSEIHYRETEGREAPGINRSRESSADGFVRNTPTKSSEPVEVGKPGINRIPRSGKSDVVDLAARDTFANAGTRLAALGFLGVGRGRPIHDINNSTIASANLSWSGAGAQQTDHEGGLPVDTRGRFATERLAQSK
jgi:hypothetical protein